MSTPVENISSEAMAKLEMLAHSLGTAVENIYSALVEDMVRSNMFGFYSCLALGIMLSIPVSYSLISMWRNKSEETDSWWATRIVPAIVCTISAAVAFGNSIRYLIDAMRPHAEAMEVFKNLL